MSARVFLTLSALGFSALATLAFAACANDEALSPLGTDADAGMTIDDAGSDAGTNEMDASTGDAGAVKRTVTIRNPMGEVPGNYFVDGDFELSSNESEEQFGWYAVDIPSGGQLVPTLIETGGLCRTGLRCAILQKDQAFFLRGAAANGKGNAVSIWAKVPSGKKCSAVKALMVGCDTLTGTFGSLKSDAASPGDDGWCHYSQTIGVSASSLCLYMTNTLASGERAVVDSAVLGPDDGTMNAKPAEAFVPDADDANALEAVAHAVRQGHRPKRKQRLRAQ